LAYTAEDVKRLREATAAGMLDCKKALDEANGDYDKAVEIIRVKGQKGVTKREGRTTSNGLVLAKAEGDVGVMLELNCETDFVAKGDRFQELANELLAHLLSSKIGEIAEFSASKMANGKTVQEVIDEGNATLGEKIELRRVAVLQGSPVALIFTAQAQTCHLRLASWFNLLRMLLKLEKILHNTLQRSRHNLFVVKIFLPKALRPNVVLLKRLPAQRVSQRHQSLRSLKVA